MRAARVAAFAVASACLPAGGAFPAIVGIVDPTTGGGVTHLPPARKFVVDGLCRHHASYRNGNTYAVSTDGGATWTHPAGWTAGGEGTIAADSQNNVHVVYRVSNSTPGHRYRKYDNGAGTWSAEMDLDVLLGFSLTDNPAMMVGGDDQLHLVVIRDSDDQVIYLRGTAGNAAPAVWNPATATDISSAPGYSQTRPAIAVDFENHLHAVWNGTEAGCPSFPVCRYRRYDAGTAAWDASVTAVSTCGGSTGYSGVAVDANANVHVVWGGGGGANLRWRTGSNGTWNGPYVVTSSPGGGEPSVATDQAGLVWFAWETPIGYRSYNPGSGLWSPTATAASAICPNTRHSVWPDYPGLGRANMPLSGVAIYFSPAGSLAYYVDPSYQGACAPATPTATHSRTLTSSHTSTRTPTPIVVLMSDTATVSRTRSGTASPVGSATHTSSRSSSASATSTGSASRSRTPSATRTPTSVASPTRTATPISSVTVTRTSSRTPSASATRTGSASRSRTASATPTPIPSPSPTAAPSSSPTAAASETSTVSAAPASSPLPTTTVAPVHPRAYPNPASGGVVVRFTGLRPGGKVRIWNLRGERVAELEERSGVAAWSAAGRALGLYVYRAEPDGPSDAWGVLAAAR